MKQLLLSSELTVKPEHGGELSRGKRKMFRPITTRRAMHVTIRSSHATDAGSFHAKRNASFIRALVPRLAKRFHVRLYECSLNSNHLHLGARPRTREGFQKFLMVLSGRIAQHVTGARKGKRLGYRFFDFIPWTRIVEWGKAIRGALSYVRKNELETWGLIPYQARRTHRAPKERPPPQ